MNPYNPPAAAPRKARLSYAAQRSPAERAFDFILLPSVICAIIAGVAASFFHLESDGEPVIRGWPVRAFQAFMVLVALHCAFGLRMIYRSWNDPFGKILRFVSSFLLLIEGLTVASAVLL